MVTGRSAAEIDGLRRALSSSEIDRIAPHVTLVPPVNVADGEVAAACDLLRSVAAGVGPLAVDLGPPGSFGPVSPVCYLAVTAEAAVLDSVAALAARLGTGPLAPPPTRPERAFVPHATLNPRMDAGSVAEAVSMLAGYRAHVVFESVTLLEYSEAERRWHELCDAPFGQPAVRGRGGLEIELSLSGHAEPAVTEWSRRAWEQHLQMQYGPQARPDEPFTITARIEDAVAGVAEGEVRGPTCLLARLMVAPERRAAGVGTLLLRATEDHASESGCVRVRVGALTPSRAEAFYRGRGYTAAGRLSRWREERDFVVMEAAVPPPVRVGTRVS